MKRSKIILSIILVVLAAVVLTSCGYDRYEAYTNYKDYIVGGASYDTDVRKIDIDWISGNVSIYAYDGETVNVYEESEIELKETEKLRCRLNGGKLDIKYVGPNTKLPRTGLRKRLYVEIPKAIAADFTEIKVDAISANVDIKELGASMLDVQTTSGEITLETCDFPICEIDSVSGSTEILSCKVAGLSVETASGKVLVENSEVTDFSVETVSGEVDFTSTIMPTAVRAESISGKITVTLPENGGFTLDYDSVSGDVSCEFPTTKSLGKYIYGDGVNVIKIKTISGNLSIRKL